MVKLELLLKPLVKNHRLPRIKKLIREVTMATLERYSINAMATRISKEFFIDEYSKEDRSHILVDEMRLFAMDMKSRVTFISRAKV